jgi:hypothetical protein
MEDLRKLSTTSRFSSPGDAKDAVDALVFEGCH